MKTPVVFNIQKFSVHDGPGIRTTIFFKGCPVHCAWCHNPESQNYQIETMLTKAGIEETVGKKYTIKELVTEIAKDQLFYDQSGGGVTFSGGEVMTQNMDYIEELAKAFNRRGISVAIDTCGVAPFSNYERLLPYTELFLYDLKFIDSLLHAQYTGASNELVLANLKKLSDSGAKIDLRMILLDSINSDDGTIRATMDWLSKESIKLESIHLLPFHEFGRDKYQRLGRTWQEGFMAPSEKRLGEIKDMLEVTYKEVTIGGD